MTSEITPGSRMFSLAKKLWPINRSLSGEGVRETLAILSGEVAGIQLRSFKSDARVFDWTVPKEWKVVEAHITTPSGSKICNFHDNNLHLVGYSEPFEGEIELEDLQQHLYSLPSQPNAIPYVTSYYQSRWGFCLRQVDRDQLQPGTYKVVVRTELFEGVLDYGELYMPGRSDREVFFSTYICHPSLANNELSGPVLAIELAKWLSERDRYYSYRFVFIPETIGSLAYMSENLDLMKRSMLAGFVLTCVGDDRQYSYLPSRTGDTLADKAALSALESQGIDFVHYSWLDRGSDERQYCSPGADLPVCSVMRSKYAEYPEYHTSLDVLGNVVTASGLEGSFEIYTRIIENLESQRYPRALTVGEPQLGKRGLWPNISIKGAYGEMKVLSDALSLMDGKTETNAIARRLGLSQEDLDGIVSKLLSENLIEI